MLPAGKITEDTIGKLSDLLSRDDCGHRRRQYLLTRTISAAPHALASKGLTYLDCGTSGGVWGLERGYCMMIGGDKSGGRPA